MTKACGWAAAALLAGCGWGTGQAPQERVGGRIDLPSSKQIVGVVPGEPRRLSSLPVSLAASPDGHWVVTVNGGYGSLESGFMQALAVLDTRTGKVEEFPDERTLIRDKQALFSGLAFSHDGKRLYGTVVSMTDPEGRDKGHAGSGVQVYGFAEGKLTRERLMRIPMHPLPAGKSTLLRTSVEAGKGEPGRAQDGTMGIPYPAGIAVVETTDRNHSGTEGSGEKLLVANHLSDEVLLMDAVSGEVLRRFDVSESKTVPGVYPGPLVASADGRWGYCALTNGSEVVQLDLVKGRVRQRMPLLKPQGALVPGSHPAALVLARNGSTLYAALANRDAVAALDVTRGRMVLKGYFNTALPGQRYFGAEPEALTLRDDGRRLYVAEMGANAVAVFDTERMREKTLATGRRVDALGFIPTEWMPMAVEAAGGKVYVATGKGTGTGPNNFAQALTPATQDLPGFKKTFTYIGALLHGSLAVLDGEAAERELQGLTAEVLESNRMRAGEERIAWDAGVGGGSGEHATAKATADSSAALRNDNKNGVGNDNKSGLGSDNEGRTESWAGPIRHVIYIIKENRTYDQILGDLEVNGRGVGNGDPGLTMYGAEITPNLHKLALQFGVLDNFYDSAEVSGDGHMWSNTAIGTDTLERTWQVNYRAEEHTYDFEGVVANGLPLEQGIPDVVEPASGYLWGNLARHGRTLYHFGEYIASTFCSEEKNGGAELDPRLGPLGPGRPCAGGNEIAPGGRLPAVWGGGVNKWPYGIALLAENKATKPELVGHFAAEYPDFNLKVPDVVRMEIFKRHLAGWVADRAAGRDTMPNFVMLRLPNDHTSGTKAGYATPRAAVADNDLAVGEAVEAISHTAYWEDTAFFILEDDAQNGADHVDAHRSIGLVVSKYAPRKADGAAYVDSRFYTTVSMIRTMEEVLGLPPMNNNDALAPVIGSVFTGRGDQAPFVADARNLENGLIYTVNAKDAAGAKASAKMDFRHADRADASKLNVILWRDAMGDKPLPGMLTEKRKRAKRDDDD